MVTREVRVVRIEAADGAMVKKQPDGRFGFEAFYVLEDGTRQPKTITKKLMRDAKAELAGLPETPKYRMWACYDGDRFMGEKVAFDLG